MLSQSHCWQRCSLARYASYSKPQLSSSLPLNKHKHSQETQATGLLLSDGTYQLSHYPQAETKQNLVTHVTRLLSKSSHSEIITSYLLTDWLIKLPKGLGFISFSFFGFHFNKLCHAAGLSSLHFCVFMSRPWKLQAVSGSTALHQHYCLSRDNNKYISVSIEECKWRLNPHYLKWKLCHQYWKVRVNLFLVSRTYGGSGCILFFSSWSMLWLWLPHLFSDWKLSANVLWWFRSQSIVLILMFLISSYHKQVWPYHLLPDFSQSLICHLSRNTEIPLKIGLPKKGAVMDCMFVPKPKFKMLKP